MDRFVRGQFWTGPCQYPRSRQEQTGGAILHENHPLPLYFDARGRGVVLGRGDVGPGQAISNFTGIWNNVMISTPAQLSVVTRTDARNGTTHVTVTEVQERTQFNAGVMTLAMDGNGNFSGPASGTITVIGPGLVRVTPTAMTPCC